MFNIDFLREVVKDPASSPSFKLAKILEEPEVANDGSAFQVQVEIVPEGYETLITVPQNENLEGGLQKEQLWIACFLHSGNINNGFLLKKVITQPDPLHPKSKMGETVISSIPKKKINISNDHSAQLTENAVLGQALKAWNVRLCEEIISLADDIEAIKNKLNSLIGKYSSHTHVVAFGVASPTPMTETPTPTTTATEKSKVNTLKGDPETDKWLSDLAFIQEKGLTNSPE